MKGKNRAMGLLMAGIIAASCTYPTGGLLFAQEQGNTAAISISGKPVTKELEKGDKFNLFIDVSSSKKM